MVKRLERHYKARTIKIQQLIDGGWRAISRGVMAYGQTLDEAEENIKALIDDGW
ncbi:MAG: hypothetical protein JOZ78_16215 [Chroococcidiopsidaceae cyanobacterium CP_BM_ER_R8_30]|nr:hypothetical protein [Chroococcidiopsidaceae cyanobacterium CP_BM_ER_R8_30]